ncbi:hypothetical protein Lalb_Chr11g0066121 [Lupinus albus]|uniref:Uncharacterized protein n=1 Tax=Lupinus albus TaxID=3870 RepID=A0A6A4PQY5_LUPAL|nr:hypothetical protein Lalb_Chr11g0066121 [Lupinus albus]
MVFSVTFFSLDKIVAIILSLIFCSMLLAYSTWEVKYSFIPFIRCLLSTYSIKHTLLLFSLICT